MSNIRNPIDITKSITFKDLKEGLTKDVLNGVTLKDALSKIKKSLFIPIIFIFFIICISGIASSSSYIDISNDHVHDKNDNYTATEVFTTIVLLISIIMFGWLVFFVGIGSIDLTDQQPVTYYILFAILCIFVIASSSSCIDIIRREKNDVNIDNDMKCKYKNIEIFMGIILACMLLFMLLFMPFMIFVIIDYYSSEIANDNMKA